ncbi:MAG: amidohydrolase family protein [Candidatus Paceibacterota bacterium]|jgi:N-acyl-D-aspartate/D-glutamate deacylase
MTLLVKNVQIIGSDQPLPEKLDLFVSGKKIAAIGHFPNKKADQIIDGQESFLSPGFIDVDTESDHYLSLFTDPEQEDFLKQGITTILGGLCGASLAPLIYGSLESIEEWADTNQVNVDWHSMAEFLAHLGKKPLGVNFTTLVGHSTIRQAIIGKVPRNLTKNELAIFGGILKKSLREGGFGFSTGLGYAQSRETPYSEIKYLAEITAAGKGLYATHLRKTGEDLLESISETIKITKETGVKTIISHFLPVEGEEKQYKEALKIIEELPPEFNFHFNLYPFKKRILKLYTFLPVWAQKDDTKVMSLSLQDEWMRNKIMKDLPEINPEDFVVAQAPGNDSLVGQSLKDVRNLYSLKSNKEALLKLMTTTNLQAIIFYKNIDEQLMKQALKSPRSLIASDAASFKENSKNKILKPDRATSTFTKFLTFVEKDKLMSLEDAIRKITYEPANKIGLKNRGLIRPGFCADLAVFKNQKVSHVVVNGQLIISDGEFIGNKSGEILKSSD